MVYKIISDIHIIHLCIIVRVQEVNSNRVTQKGLINKNEHVNSILQTDIVSFNELNICVTLK